MAAKNWDDTGLTDGDTISTTEWEDMAQNNIIPNSNFRTTPSSIITAGSNLSWSTNTLSLDGSVSGLTVLTFSSEYDKGDSGTADTVDWANGQKQKSTLTDNVTFTFTAPSGVGNFLLKLVQDSTGSRTVTWPSNVKWPSGTAPTLSTSASAVDIVSFLYDGTNYYGSSSLDFS